MRCDGFPSLLECLEIIGADVGLVHLMSSNAEMDLTTGTGHTLIISLVLTHVESLILVAPAS